MPPTEPDNLDSRRGFLRRALRDVGRAAGAVLGAGLPGASKPGANLPGAAAGPVDPSLTLLRPPGAVDDFERLCRSCGRCSRACPHGAIRMAPRAAVVAALQPCRMCEGFPCAAACPTGAQAVPQGPVRMGIAIWSALRCHLSDRVEANNASTLPSCQCDICRTACPAGAIRVEAGRIRVDGDRCTGCGVCEYSCPQRPRAIYIDPL